uniref:Ig-like domain-containing protein n=1 Tax=Esox lucius TaxID=8010 RepID=A0A3P8XRL8_ESOLU
IILAIQMEGNIFPLVIKFSEVPKAVLSISPQWMNPGDSVTLNCEFKESSTGWRFSWYKTVPYRAGSAGPTDTGGYVCRAGRGDPVYYTDYSQPQFLWSGGNYIQNRFHDI